MKLQGGHKMAKEKNTALSLDHLHDGFENGDPFTIFDDIASFDEILTTAVTHARACVSILRSLALIEMAGAIKGIKPRPSPPVTPAHLRTQFRAEMSSLNYDIGLLNKKLSDGSEFSRDTLKLSNNNLVWLAGNMLEINTAYHWDNTNYKDAELVTLHNEMTEKRAELRERIEQYNRGKPRAKQLHTMSAALELYNKAKPTMSEEDAAFFYQNLEDDNE
jgi:hypothetical protein